MNTPRMVTMWPTNEACPVCGASLNTDGKMLYCPQMDYRKPVNKHGKKPPKKPWGKRTARGRDAQRDRED